MGGPDESSYFDYESEEDHKPDFDYSTFDERPFKNQSTIANDHVLARHEKWDNIIKSATLKSARAQIEGLSKTEQAKVLRNEWLVNYPLTGICTGLAIEFLLDSELKKELPTMQPSNEARYWEKLLIPVMENVMRAHFCEDPDQLTGEHHFRAVYKEMIKIIEEKAHVKASINYFHLPMSQLAEKLHSNQGHCLVCIERPGKAVADNHMIYINPRKAIIADYSVILEVPEEDNFDQFTAYYLKKEGCENAKFTLISVQKDSRFESVRKPSMNDRLTYSLNRSLNYLIKSVRVPSAFLEQSEITPFFFK